MILSISGPASTGKSTILSDLLKVKDKIEKMTEGLPVKFNTEGARHVWTDIYSKQYETIDDLMKDSDAFIRWQLDLVAEYAESTKDQNSHLLITDRCELDCLVYTMMKGDQSNPGYLRVLERINKIKNDPTRHTTVYLTTDLGFVSQDGMRAMTYDRDLETHLFRVLSGMYSTRSILPDRATRINQILFDIDERFRYG